MNFVSYANGGGSQCVEDVRSKVRWRDAFALSQIDRSSLYGATSSDEVLFRHFHLFRNSYIVTLTGRLE